jgi:hypothetical protein
VKRRSFLGSVGALLAAVCTPVAAAAAAPKWFVLRRWVLPGELARDFQKLREPVLLAGGPLLLEPGADVWFFDPDRVYRAPGDLTKMTRGSYAFPQLGNGKFYACRVVERRGDLIRTVIDPCLSWF